MELRQGAAEARVSLLFGDSHTFRTVTCRPDEGRASASDPLPVHFLDVHRLLGLNQCRISKNASDWGALEDWVSDPSADR